MKSPKALRFGHFHHFARDRRDGRLQIRFIATLKPPLKTSAG
jgi:hypothetical protein